MSELTELLARLEDQWRRHDLPIYARLRPGLGEDEIRTRLAAVGVLPPREYVEWFGWHDGADAESRMTPLLRIETLDRCIEQYNDHVLPGGLDEETNAGWFPVATTIGGAVIVCDCTGSSADLAVTTVVQREGNRYDPEYHLASLAEPVGWWVNLFATDKWTRWDGIPEAVKPHLDEQDLSVFPQAARQQGFV